MQQPCDDPDDDEVAAMMTRVQERLWNRIDAPYFVDDDVSFSFSHAIVCEILVVQNQQVQAKIHLSKHDQRMNDVRK